MTTFMEQVHYSDRWQNTEQPGSGASSKAIPGENRPIRDNSRTARKSLLASIVKAEILPRLARMRHDQAAIRRDYAVEAAVAVGTSAVDRSTLTTDTDTRELIRLLLTREASEAVVFLDKLRLRGVTPASLYLGVLSEAAHGLGELWDQDQCDFAQVTISMGRLQQVLRALSPHFQAGSLRRAQTETVLLVPAPGEQHTFGLVMLAEFFRREGWNVAGGPVTTAKDATDIVRSAWIDVAGFSIGSAARLEGLAQCIRAVRRGSHNPNLYVIVGGPLFLTQPDLVMRVGADAVATDAAGAVRQASGLLARQMAAD